MNLEEENEFLRLKVRELEKKVQFLETHTTIQQGIVGETLVKKLTGGLLTSNQESYDVKVGDNIKIEVKKSKLHRPNKKYLTGRWSWKNVLGLSGKKEYDFLLLMGDKDSRFSNQYPDDSPYVFFLIPQNEVEPLTVKHGPHIHSAIQITSDLSGKGLQRKNGEIKRKLIKYRIDQSIIEAIGKLPDVEN